MLFEMFRFADQVKPFLIVFIGVPDPELIGLPDPGMLFWIADPVLDSDPDP